MTFRRGVNQLGGNTRNRFLTTPIGKSIALHRIQNHHSAIKHLRQKAAGLIIK